MKAKKKSKVILKVNCKRFSIDSGVSESALHFLKPRVNGGQVNDMKITHVNARLKNGKVFKVFENKRIADGAIRHFGKRIEMDLQSQTMYIKNISSKDEGNYTSIWSWEKDHVPVTTEFTLIVRVPKTRPPTKTPDEPIPEPGPTGQNNSSLISTDEVPRLGTPKPKSGGTWIKMSTLCFLVSTLSGILAAGF